MVLNKKELRRVCSPHKDKHAKTGRPIMPRPVSSHVKVFVRVRPLNDREQRNGCRNVVKVCDDKTLIFDPKEEEQLFFFHGVAQKGRDINKRANKNMVFEFDRVFDGSCTNDEVYESTTKELVSALFDGYNCSVFAYGATGAGKTFTMLGSQSQPGITYLTIVQLLSHIESVRETMSVTMGASYLEVYNENVKDLLHPSSLALHLREDNGYVTVSGLGVDQIKDSQTLFTLLERGNENRSQHPTDSNAESSRSHAVFQVHLKIVNKTNNQVKMAKLSMIDLAGSERGAATGFSGLRFKEGSNINKSLLALGNCINALADGLKHVPYRDSKLTRILKDSLGGNCRTVMVANVSPSSSSFDDTSNTLKYANRAKSIKSNVSKNIFSNVMTVVQYKKLVEELKAKIAELETQGMNTPDLKEWNTEIETVMNERLNIHEKIFSLQSQQKINEWRINKKQSDLQLIPDSQKITRLNASIGQLRARCAGISEKLDEFFKMQMQNTQKKDNLIQRIMSAKLCPFLQPKLDFWSMKIEKAEKIVQEAHTSKLFKLLKKQEEAYASAVSVVVPVFKEYYNLLHAHSHVTQPLTIKYETALRSLDGLKTVSWNDSSDEEDDSSNNHEFLHLPHVEAAACVRMKNITDSDKEKTKGKLIVERTLTPLKTQNTTLPLPPRRVTGGLQLKAGSFKSRFNKENISDQNGLVTKLRTPSAVNKLKVSKSKSTLRVHPYQNTTSSLKKKLVLP